MSQSFTNRVVLPDGSVVTRPADLPPRASAYLEALANSAHQDADRAEAAAQGVGAGAVAAAEAAAAAAAASQGGAADSALAAATSAANSSTSADAAAGSAGDAADSAAAAAASATAAAGSATAADSQADAAAGSATAAATSADEAEAFRNQANGYRTDAMNARNAAIDARDLASGYAADALASAGSAEDSADAAAASAASIEPTSLVKRDGGQGMTGELPLAGNATQALSAVPKQQLDAGLADKVDVGAISSFWYGVLPAADAAEARTGLDAVGLTGNETIAGNKTFSGDTSFTGDVGIGPSPGGPTSGYVRLPTGVIMQWGIVSGGSGAVTITFPITFPIQILSLALSLNDAATAGFVSSAWTSSVSTSGATVQRRFTDGNSVSNSGGAVRWIAVGY